MGVSDVACQLPAEPMSVDPPPADTPQLMIDAGLGYRLANAKANLDRLEQQTHSRDDSALASARIEFALASRALANDLILHHGHGMSEK
ncbi:hypothetical protein BWR19_02965 [Halomonas sp. 1513]|nr:hypothetical protein [Halomonas sp. 1513]APX91993.1 hypothetical protein BWR19_02965 [Halomonas sp. 1513]